MFYLFPPNFYAFEGLRFWGSSLLFNFLEVLSSCFARLFTQPFFFFVPAFDVIVGGWGIGVIYFRKLPRSSIFLLFRINF